MPQPTIESTGLVTATGIGRRDYSEEVSLGNIRAGYSLKVNQTLKLFFLAPSSKRVVGNPYPWVTDPLVASGSAHLVDAATGLATPFTVPAGYTLSLIERSFYGSRQTQVWLYMDGHVIANPAMLGSYWGMQDNPVVAYTTAWIDPTAALPHTVDCIVFNIDGMNPLEGGFSITAILEAIATPPRPETKVVKCHNCGTLNEVHWTTSTVKCRGCGGTVITVVEERALHVSREGRKD